MLRLAIALGVLLWLNRSLGAATQNVVTSEVDASQRPQDSFLGQAASEAIFGDKFGP